MQKLLTLFISLFFNTGVFTLVDFTFLPCRSCYLRSLHIPPMQKLLLSFIFPSSHVGSLVYATYLQSRSCYFLSLKLSPMEKLLLSFSSLSFILLFSNPDVVILFHFTFTLFRRCYPCPCHLLLMHRL